MTFGMRMGLAFLVLAGALLLFTFEHPPIQSRQQGYRGTAMAELDPMVTLVDYAATLPEAQPAASAEGPRAGEVYENVQVLNDLSEEQFNRLMAAITDWVSPNEGCTYCHDDDGNLALDNKYTKVVARRMIEMTRHINTDWTSHVDTTGVTCYTCHRGQPVPSYVWFSDTEADTSRGSLGNRQGQNIPSLQAGLTSLPSDPLTPYLANQTDIRVVPQAALPTGPGASIKQAEETYGLMIHLSESLGVNCTFCHNSRSFSSWDQSNQPRTTAYRGISMVRELNADYLAALKTVLPPERLGPHGDFPKVDCSTCHQQEFKPLAGLSMLADNPELAVAEEAGIEAAGTAPTETAPTEAAPTETAPPETAPAETAPDQPAAPAEPAAPVEPAPATSPAPDLQPEPAGEAAPAPEPVPPEPAEPTPPLPGAPAAPAPSPDPAAAAPAAPLEPAAPAATPPP